MGSRLRRARHVLPARRIVQRPPPRHHAGHQPLGMEITNRNPDADREVVIHSVRGTQFTSVL